MKGGVDEYRDCESGIGGEIASDRNVNITKTCYQLSLGGPKPS